VTVFPLEPAGLRARAARIRRHVVGMAASPEGCHAGGSLSCADVLAVLYFGVLRLRPGQPDWPDRDHFVLSKGHASAALYAALAERGFLPPAELATYARPGGRLAGHPLRRVPGVEFPTGSLGHGLALGLGLALADRLDGRPGRTFVLLGDGELQEGTIWEALTPAAQHRLDNLVAIVDRNGWQITGRTEDVGGLEPLPDRFRAFGWEAREVDGHDVEALLAELSAVPRAPGRPTALVARTVKGRGVPFLEGRRRSHYVRLDERLERRALASLPALGGREQRS
jgi:transketolase